MALMTPWSYRAGMSPLHRCPAGIKLLFLPALSAAPFLGPPAMGASAALLLLGAAAGGIPPWKLLAGSRPLGLMLIIVSISRGLNFGPPLSFSLEGFCGGLHFGSGIMVSFAAGSLLFSVTTMTEIRKALERAELFILRPFSRRRGYLSLALGMMLGFLPRFFELWEAAELACKARACTGSIRRLGAVLPLVTERMIEMAGETAAALEARGLEL